MHRRLGIACYIVASAGCTSPASEPQLGPVAKSVAIATAETRVPADLVLAIAAEEGGLALPAVRLLSNDDPVPVAGILELRHGRLDTLALGARLVGSDEATLRVDTDLGTRAGVRVLAELGASAGPELASWRDALERLSGMDDFEAKNYASRVFAILRAGGDLVARDGERIHLAAHPELDERETLQAAAREVPGGAGYPGAIWFTTSCANKCTPGRPLGNSAVDKIVIHDTEGGWDGSVATLQYDGGKSVHYIIDADGSRVGQFLPETDTTWHAGNYFYNETSIGIEHVGTASDPNGYSTGLYAKSRDLVKNIRTRWNVPVDREHIVGHYQIPDGNQIAESSPPCTDTLDHCETSASFGGADNHRDPGYNWQWCQYMQGLGGTCTCHDAWPLWNCTTDKTEAVRCANGVVEIRKCDGGCVSMPVGKDDVCHTSVGPGMDAGTGATPDGGSSGGGADGAGSGGNGTHAGCAAGGNGGAAGGGLVLFAVAAAIGARRRRRA